MSCQSKILRGYAKTDTCDSDIAALFCSYRRERRAYPAPKAPANLDMIRSVNEGMLRHANLSTARRYLGTVSDVEATKWIGNVYG